MAGLFALSVSLVAAIAAQQSFAHTLGKHLLDGIDSPPSTPSLPEIAGPFEIKVKARYDNFESGAGWQRLIDFGNGPAQQNIVLTQMFRRQDIWFTMFCDGGVPSNYVELQANGVINNDEVAQWTIGLDTTGLMYLKKGTALLASRNTTCVPANVPRTNKYLGKSNWNGNEPLRGAILGIQVRNLNEPKSLSNLEYNSYPGQIYTGAFVASMWTRVDRLTPFHGHHPLGSQRFFDFSVEGDYGVYFGQVGNTTDVKFGIYQNSVEYAVTMENAIVLDEFAFWHVGVDNDRTMWIQKNGEVPLASTGELPANIFRKTLIIGSSWEPLNHPLDGIVLGLRVDIVATS